MLEVLLERYQAGKRGDDDTQRADVDRYEQFAPVIRKVRKEDSRRNVTDELAGDNTRRESALFNDSRNKALDRIDLRDITREDKEYAEGRKQGVVNVQKSLAVEDRNENDDDCER